MSQILGNRPKTFLRYSCSFSITLMSSFVELTFFRYNQLQTRVYLSSLSDFRNCLSSGCSAGQIHKGGAENPLFTYDTCGHKSCTVHDVPWHENEGCAAYDKRIRESTAKDNATLIALVQKSAKACPKCKSPIEKNSSCEHITCSRCKHQFCYLCLANYEEIRAHGNSSYKRKCLHHTGNILEDWPQRDRRRRRYILL